MTFLEIFWKVGVEFLGGGKGLKPIYQVISFFCSFSIFHELFIIFIFGSKGLLMTFLYFLEVGVLMVKVEEGVNKIEVGLTPTSPL